MDPDLRDPDRVARRETDRDFGCVTARLGVAMLERGMWGRGATVALEVLGNAAHRVAYEAGHSHFLAQAVVRALVLLSDDDERQDDWHVGCSPVCQSS